MTAKKDRERHFVERARALCSEFPEGTFVDHEEPDFIIDRETDRLGIEVTQLFHPKGSEKFPGVEIEGFHRNVMRRAEALATKEGVTPSMSWSTSTMPKCWTGRMLFPAPWLTTFASTRLLKMLTIGYRICRKESQVFGLPIRLGQVSLAGAVARPATFQFSTEHW